MPIYEKKERIKASIRPRKTAPELLIPEAADDLRNAHFKI